MFCHLCLYGFYYNLNQFRGDRKYQISYFEFKDKSGETIRKYVPGSRFFSATQESTFEVSFLKQVTLDLTLLDGRFQAIVEKYNTTFDQNIKALDLCCLEVAWVMFETSLLLPDFQFSILRNAYNAIDQEDLCRQASSL